MKKHSIEVEEKATVVWENLESLTREKVRSFVQELLEEEITERLERGKSERKKSVDASRGLRNGYGKARKLTLQNGTITIQRPRVRGLEKRFESRLLPLFARRTQEVAEMIPELYLHGLALGDFDLALRGILGEDAPLSPGTVARLKEKWQAELWEWRQRSLAGLEVVFLWVDGVYVKAGLEKDKATILVALAGLSNGTKVVVGIQSGYRESNESWSEFLRDLKARGMVAPKLTVGDGNLGIWNGLGAIYPESEEQRCWNHRMVNILDKVAKSHQWEAKQRLQTLVASPDAAKAEEQRLGFEAWCQKKGFTEAAGCIRKDWEQMITFYRFPQEHWKHIRTSNPIESPFAMLRIRTHAAKRYKKTANAIAVIWKMLMVAEKRFRRLNAPELLKEVYLGVKFEDGKKILKGAA